MASRVLDAVIPGFADAAGMYVLEQLLSDGTPVWQVTGTGKRRLAVRSWAPGPRPPASLPSGGFPVR